MFGNLEGLVSTAHLSGVGMLVAIACVFLGLLCTAESQYLPVPARYPGHVNGSGPIIIEEFMDFQCLHCAEAWHVITEVVSAFSSHITYIQHCFPLWLHHQAFDACTASWVVGETNPAVFWQFADYLFANQPIWNQTAWFGKSQSDFWNLLASWAAKFGISEQTFLAGMASTSIYDLVDADIHAGIINQVYHARLCLAAETPTFVVNGVKVNLNRSSTFEDWSVLINSLINASTRKIPHHFIL